MEEDRNEPVMGYPFKHIPSNFQPYDHPYAQPSHTTTTTTDTVRVNVVQPPPFRANPNTSHPYTDRHDKLIGCIFFALCLVLVVFFVVEAHQVQNRHVQLRVDSIFVDHFNLSASQTAPNFNISFFIRNPDKNTPIFCDMAGASIFYKNEHLAGTNLDPFHLNIKEQRFVQANLNASINGWVGSGIVEDKDQSRVVEFNVKFQAMILLDPGTKYENKGTIRASCDGVKVRFSSPMMGSLLGGGSVKCKVYQRSESARGF